MTKSWPVMKNQQKALQERVKRLLFLNQYKDLKATSAYYSRSIQFLQYIAICYMLFIRIWRDPSWTLSTFGLSWIDNAAMRPLQPFCLSLAIASTVKRVKFGEQSERAWASMERERIAFSLHAFSLIHSWFAFCYILQYIIYNNI